MTSRSLCVMPGPALARHLVAAGHVDDVDRVVDELAAVLRGEVVAAALDEEQLRRRRSSMSSSSASEVVADVLADRGVRAAAGLDGADLTRRAAPRARWRNSASSRVKMSFVTTPRRTRSRSIAAEREQQRRLAAPDRPADADGEGARGEVARGAARARLAVAERARVVGVIVVVRVLVVGSVSPWLPGVSLTTGRAGSRGDRAALPTISRSGAVCAASPAPRPPHSATMRSRSEAVARCMACASCAAGQAEAHRGREDAAGGRVQAHGAARRRATRRARRRLRRRAARGARGSARRGRRRRAAQAPPRRSSRAHAAMNARPWVRLARLATCREQEGVARRVELERRARARVRAPATKGSEPCPACQSASSTKRATAPLAPKLAELRRRLEPGRVREAACGERRVGELEDERIHRAGSSEERVPLRERQRVAGSHVGAARRRRAPRTSRGRRSMRGSASLSFMSRLPMPRQPRTGERRFAQAERRDRPLVERAPRHEREARRARRAARARRTSAACTTGCGVGIDAFGVAHLRPRDEAALEHELRA